jgi:hypothetical protein
MSPSASYAIRPFAAGPYGGAGRRAAEPTITIAAVTTTSNATTAISLQSIGAAGARRAVMSMGSHLSGNIQAGR